MNIARLRILQRVLAETDTFDQELYWEGDDQSNPDWGLVSCQTPACVAGHAVYLFRDEGERIDPYVQTGERAAELLGLNDEQRHKLFIGHPYWPNSGDNATATEAIAAIDSLIETGEVKWPERGK